MDDKISQLKETEKALRESQEKYKELFENVSDFLYFHDLEGNFTDVNLSFVQESGYTKQELIGMNIRDLVPEMFKEEVDNYLKEILSQGTSEGFISIERKDGSAGIAEYRNSLIYADGEPISVRGVSRDMTEEILQKRALRESEERYRAIFEQAVDSIVIVNADTAGFIDFNERAYENLGYTSEEFRALKISDFEVIENEADVKKHINKILEDGEDSFETKHRSKNGDVKNILVNSRAIDFRGHQYILSIWRDITDRKHLEERLRRYSYLDELTGVANRRQFERILTQEWKRAARDKNSISLAIADIDFFKQYNDTYGHIEGDQCLKRVAQCLSDTLRRPADFVARYGGEEFAVILPGIDKPGGQIVAEALRENVESLKIDHPSSTISDYLTISLGVAAVSPHKDIPPEVIVISADRALYRAKRDGRNRAIMID